MLLSMSPRSLKIIEDKIYFKEERDWFASPLSYTQVIRSEVFQQRLEKIEEFIRSFKELNKPFLFSALENFLQCLFKESYLKSLQILQNMMHQRYADKGYVEIIQTAIFVLREVAKNLPDGDDDRVKLILEQLGDNNLPECFREKKEEKSQPDNTNAGLSEQSKTKDLTSSSRFFTLPPTIPAKQPTQNNKAANYQVPKNTHRCPSKIRKNFWYHALFSKKNQVKPDTIKGPFVRHEMNRI